MMQILTHTPLWVFGLFFGLVYLGYLQRKAGQVSGQRLIVLPVVMMGWSLYSVWSTFDAHVTALAAWACAWGAVVALGLAQAPLQGASYDADAKQFTVPGSWVPLALMMGIFFVKYAVAVMHAIKPGMFDATTAVAVVAGTYGLFSGLFMARALRVLSMMKPVRLVERSA